MTNPDELASPDVRTTLNYDILEGQSFPETYSTGGLTKRELFAAMAMQGLLAHSSEGLANSLERGCSEEKVAGRALIARWSVEQADALIAELNRTAKPE